jgi:hypothetical protein
VSAGPSFRQDPSLFRRFAAAGAAGDADGKDDAVAGLFDRSIQRSLGR